jgi:hypothetical protein
MQPLHIGPYRLLYDSKATRAAHALYRTGSPEECTCTPCRNWAAARKQAYSPAFLQLLETLGLPPDGESEIYHIYRPDPGTHIYQGWFHFVGLISASDAPVTTPPPAEFMSIHTDLALVPEPLKRHPVIQFEFQVLAPWLLPDPEPS